MIIGVDANVLARQRKTGVDYLARGLLAELVKHLPNDQFVLCYFGQADPKTFGVAGPNVSYQAIKFPGKLYRAFLHYLRPLPFDLIAKIKADVWFFPDFICLPTTSGKRVVYIHDLTFKRYPQHTFPRTRRLLTREVKQAVRVADAIVVNSHHTQADLVLEYNLDPKRVTVAPPAVDRSQFKPAAAAKIMEVRAKFGIDSDYLLFTGTVEPRKNLSGLLAAYQKLDAALRNKYCLVLAGGKGWLDEKITEQLTELKAAGVKIITTGYVAEDDLPVLYSGATAFVYPSFYEGFGMPVLEAMACDVPVITSNTSSLPEVAGKAALLINPQRPSDIAAAITKLLGDEKLQKNLVEEGRKQVERFSWADSAKTLAGVIKKL